MNDPAFSEPTSLQTGLGFFVKSQIGPLNRCHGLGGHENNAGFKSTTAAGI
jgi:hypothetical protein